MSVTSVASSLVRWSPLANQRTEAVSPVPAKRGKWKVGVTGVNRTGLNTCWDFLFYFFNSSMTHDLGFWRTVLSRKLHYPLHVDVQGHFTWSDFLLCGPQAQSTHELSCPTLNNVTPGGLHPRTSGGFLWEWGGAYIKNIQRWCPTQDLRRNSQHHGGLPPSTRVARWGGVEVSPCVALPDILLQPLSLLVHLSSLLLSYSVEFLLAFVTLCL